MFIFSENWSVGSREEGWGHTGFIEIKLAWRLTSGKKYCYNINLINHGVRDSFFVCPSKSNILNIWQVLTKRKMIIMMFREGKRNLKLIALNLIITTWNICEIVRCEQYLPAGIACCGGWWKNKKLSLRWRIYRMTCNKIRQYRMTSSKIRQYTYLLTFCIWNVNERFEGHINRNLIRR